MPMVEKGAANNEPELIDSWLNHGDYFRWQERMLVSAAPYCALIICLAWPCELAVTVTVVHPVPRRLILASKR